MSFKKNSIISTAIGIVSLFCLASPVFAHVIVHPSQIGIATVQEFTLTMPNEKNIPTVALKLVLPPGLADVIPNETPGWTVSTQTKNNHVTEIDWTNGNLPVGQRVDFLFQAQVPPTPTILKWKAYQTYSDGEVVSWDQAPASDNPMDMKGMTMKDFTKMGPYSTTQVINDLTGSNMAMSQSSADTSSNTENMALGISIIAGILSVVNLVMLLKEKKR